MGLSQRKLMLHIYYLNAGKTKRVFAHLNAKYSDKPIQDVFKKKVLCNIVKLHKYPEYFLMVSTPPQFLTLLVRERST